jgi:uncharacterized membrane protein YqjE
VTEAGPTPPEAAGAAPPPPQANGHDTEPETGPARALTLHLLHMLETRMDAAGIALNTEVQTFSSRMQLRLIAAGALFIAIWGGIVLLAIALPEPYRIPVLSIVVGGFALGAVWAQVAAKRKVASTEVGSMRWFLDSLKADLEVLSRTLNRRRPVPPPTQDRSANDDLAA